MRMGQSHPSTPAALPPEVDERHGNGHSDKLVPRLLSGLEKEGQVSLPARFWRRL